VVIITYVDERVRYEVFSALRGIPGVEYSGMLAIDRFLPQTDAKARYTVGHAV
jgi:hypothetical protein